MIFLLIILIAVPVSFWYSAKTAKAAWWNDSWAYRRELTGFTSSSDFQIQVTVDTQTLVTDGKLQNSCQDLRFIDRRTGIILNYWIEENNPGCNQAATKIWVRLPANVAPTSIYMYYGNPSVAAYQSGDKTFQFFDDFNGSQINPAKWDQVIQGSGGTISQTGGAAVLTPTPNTTSSANLRSIQTFTNGIAIETRKKQASNSNYFDLSLGAGSVVDADNGGSTDWWHTSLASGYDWYFQDSGNAVDGIYRMPASGGKASVDTGAVTSDASSYKVHRYTYLSTGAITWSIDGASVRSGTDAIFASDNKKILISQGEYTNGAGEPQSIDYIFVRKYTGTDTAATVGSEERGPGPAAYWHFDEGQGNTTQDSTVNNNDGTITGATWKPESECLAGKCLDYDGTDDVTTVTQSASINLTGKTGYTLSTWIRADGAGENNTGEIIDKGANTYLRLDNPSGSNLDIEGQIDLTTSPANLNISAGVQINKWYYIELVYEDDGDDEISIYIDGALKGTSSGGDGSLPTETNNFLVGGDSSNNFNGAIDETKIYSYARTADQVKSDYNAGLAGQSAAEGAAVAVGESPKWMTDGLVGHWKMDESSGTSVADSSGNGNTGTLTNAQETGTGEAAGTTTMMADDDNANLSTTDDAYNGMILRITGGGGCGIAADTERLITDYDYEAVPTRRITTDAFSAETDSCTFEVRHQTGGKFGNGLGFDGDNDYVTKADGGASDPLRLTGGNITLSAWVKPRSASGEQKVIDKRNGWNSLYGYSLFFSGGQMFIEYGNGSTYTQAQPSDITSLYTLNTWHFVTVTLSGSNISFYFDGNNVGNTTGPVGMGADATAFAIGRSVGRNSMTYNGFIDDARVWSRALSPDEVKQLSEWGPGPVGWWKMDEKVSGDSKTLYDSSGNGNNATTYYGANATGMDCTVLGKYGGACQFDGADDYANGGTGSSLDITGSITLDAWIKPDTLVQASNPEIMTKGASTVFYRMRFNNGGTMLFNAYGTSDDTLNSISNLTAGSWNHVVMVYDGATKKIYLNGKLDVQENTTGIMDRGTGTETLYVGGFPGSERFDGSLDDVRVYNYARTPKQITEDMNAGHPVGGSPLGSQLAYWKLDEGYSTTAQDSSQNNKDLTLSAVSWANSGKFGRAFDGGDNKRIADGADDDDLDFSATEDFALTGWVKSADNPAVTQYVIHKQTDNEGYAVYMETDGDLVFGIGDTSSASFPEDTAGNAGRDFADGNWHHYAAVKTSNTRIDMYVDGVLIGSDTSLVADGTLENTATLYLGDADAADGTNEFLGDIDEVKIYNAALTAEQVKLDMNQGKALQLGGQTSATSATGQAAEYCVPGDSTSCSAPVAEWKFDEKTGTVANDVSGNGKTGTLTNMEEADWKSTSFCKFGSCPDFDGSDEFVDVGAGPSTVKSVSFWIRPATTTEYAIDLNGSAYIWVNAGTVTATGFTSPTIYVNGIKRTSGGVSANAWTHIEVTTATGIDASDLDIGRLEGTDYLQGRIDMVRLYDYARTPAQVAYDLDRGRPRGWWRMEEGVGTWAYPSKTIGSSILTYLVLTSMDQATDWVDGKIGKGLDFDGSNDRLVSIVWFSFFSGTFNNLSWGGWVKPTTSIASKSIFHKYQEHSLTTDADGKANCKIYSGSWQTAAISANALPLDAWSHVMCTYDGQNIKVYVNGVLSGTQPETDNITATTGIGTAYYYAAYPVSGSGLGYFKGVLDDLRIYSYPLTPLQIQEAMNEGSAVRFGP